MVKDLVGNNLSLGDKCYYIHNNKNGWNLAIVEVVDVNPSEEYESKNYHGWYGEGDLSNPITPFTLIINLVLNII